MSAPPPDIRDPDVLSFLDYRSYLRALYQTRKKRYAFSFRAFSRRAGLRSPNYLKLVIDAERNLSGAMARRFAKACGLRVDDHGNARCVSAHLKPRNSGPAVVGREFAAVAGVGIGRGLRVPERVKARVTSSSLRS